MTDSTADQLKRIGDANEPRMQSRRGDGTLNSPPDRMGRRRLPGRVQLLAASGSPHHQPGRPLGHLEDHPA